jgi:galactokinase
MPMITTSKPPLLEQFLSRFGASYIDGGVGEIRSFFAPGRVNLIGEHIDYHGGHVFPAALTLGITALVRKNGSNLIRMVSLNAAKEVILNTQEEILYERGDWGNYPKGVLLFLRNLGYTLPGCDILFDSTLPEGAGLSSSAALEVLTTYMLLHLMGEKGWDKVRISEFAQKVENKFVQVNCGIMDQFAVAMGKENRAILLDCGHLQHTYVPLNLETYSLVILNTNKQRELAASKYNERLIECEEALSSIQAHEKVSSLCEVTHKQIQRYIKSEKLKKRTRHVVSENKRVMKAVKALKKGDLLRFATLLTHSHMSLKYDYEVTGFELDTIVDEALLFEDCIGARMTGAGFGGCAIALVKTDSVEAFQQTVSVAYEKKTSLVPSFYESKIGDGVREIKAF